VDAVIAWCGFLGSWLLFAGPVYQASLELREQDLERERIEATTAAVARAPEVSAWWWLLPPVRFWLERRRSQAYRHAVLAALAPPDLEALVHYLHKAVGWLLVGLGGLLLATKETWELSEHYDWPLAVFWVGVVISAAAAMAYPAISFENSRRMLARRVDQ
jgi:hypothetical protein